jgi:CRISPR type IV-associated protein Csf1
MNSYPTHLIYQALGKPVVETERCIGICAFCGTEIQEGVRLDDTISDAFTNFDQLTDRAATHVCEACNACVKEPKLRRMNFIATEQGITYFKRDQIEKLLFNPPVPPFVFAVTESMKKHMSFRAKVNYSQKLFYIQKEDTQILFSPNKYQRYFEAMKRLYRSFSKTAIGSGEFQQNFIKKYGLHEFMQDENIIKIERGSMQFELLLFAMNMSDENLKKMKERIAKKEQKEREKNGM